jgi:hypothetical protein
MDYLPGNFMILKITDIECQSIQFLSESVDTCQVCIRLSPSEVNTIRNKVIRGLLPTMGPGEIVADKVSKAEGLVVEFTSCWIDFNPDFHIHNENDGFVYTRHLKTVCASEVIRAWATVDFCVSVNTIRTNRGIMIDRVSIASAAISQKHIFLCNLGRYS